MGSVGGVTRTFGLQHHFSKPEDNGPPVPITKAILKRILLYFRPYWRQWVIILFCILITSGLSVLPPFCVGMILDEALPEKKSTLLALLAGAMVVIAVGVGLIGVLQQTLTTRSGQNIMFDLKNEMYRHLQQMSLHFFTSTRSGEIMSRINNDVNAIQGVATGTIVSIVSNVAILTATSIALFSRNWKLALLAIAVVPAFYMPSRVVGRIRNRLATETQESYASLMGFLYERLNVSGSLLMKIFGRRAHDAENFAKRTERVRDLNIRQAIVGRWLFMILSVFSALGPALIYWYGGLQVLKTELTPGLLVAFAALLTLLYRPLTQLATVYADIQGAVAVFYRIFEYLDMKPIVQDKVDARSLPTTRGHIVFENVSFAYPRKPLPPAGIDAEPVVEEGPDLPPKPFAMENVSFEINPGEQVALVGPSGAGKTTITYLLPRFYDPDSGRITLDGIDLRDIAQESMRSHIGMVTQETYLFHSSIRANLLYAKPDATQDEIINACKAANIHDFVLHLPDGYDTVVGDRGFRLSGGEKQRVSIARALLKNPSILILDEATSSLDATSEYLIQEALEKLLRGRTSLIIAHRLSTILSSNKIVVMDAGQIVESGPHADLLKQNGLYSRLFQQQFSKILNPKPEGRCEQ